MVNNPFFLTKMNSNILCYMKKNNTHVLLSRILKPLFQFVLIIGAILTGISWGYAQTGSASGKIFDSAGLPLIGANIVVKGTTIGTISDLDGNYTLTGINAGKQVLVASFIGFSNMEQTIEIKANQITNLDFTLAEDITSLDELVVIGYGVQKKKLSTGATSQVQGEDLEKLRTTDALQAMQGQMTGVNIRSTSGQPGEDFKVTIRGLGTIGNAGPLYVVDGVPVGDIKYLNAADIQSIDILKDAASAAIYGSQSANGVILITTKQGTSGKSQISFDASYGIQNRPKNIDLLNAYDYARIMNEQHLNSGGSVDAIPFNTKNLPAYTSLGNADTDWLDEMFSSNAVTQNYSLGVTGGNDLSSYSLSLSYTGQEGIIGGENYSNYERIGARINTEHKLYNDLLTIGEHLTFAHTNKKGISVGNQYNNSLRSAFNVSPLLPMYNDNGEFFNTADKSILDQFGNPYWLDTEANPYANMVYNNQNLRASQNLVGDLYAIVQPISHLKYRTSLSLNYYSEDYRSYTPEYNLSMYAFSNFSKVTQSMSKNATLNFDQTLSYDMSLGTHKFDAMVGMWMSHNKSSWINGGNAYLAYDDFEHAWLNNATNTDEATLKIVGGAPDEYSMLSYFGRLQYNYNETYLFNATFRADGSSRFYKENRWGRFPSVSAGWVITNESFMDPISHIVNFLKLYGSWGRVGNQNVGNHMYLAPIKFTQATYNFGNTEGINSTGAYLERLPNPDIKWETSEQLNFGFNSRFLNSNLNVNFDWYRKITKDWLIIAPILATAGTEPPYINGGNVNNTGVELGLTYQNSFGNFEYSFNLNGSYNKNDVQDIPTEDGTVHGATNMLFANSPEFYQAKSGHPIGYFWGYETDGLFQNSAEVQAYTSASGKVIQPDARPGDVRYVDQNGDGNLNDNDKIEIGDPNPDFTYGLNFNCSYKGFDFLLSANGMAGNQIVQSYRDHTGKYSNYTTEVLERWHGEGTSDRIPRVTNSNINYIKFSDLFIYDGDFLRISNVTIGYDFSKIINAKNLSQCRLYASVQNLYTFSSYNGMDPEVGFGLDNGESDKFSSGIDLGFYPRPRTVLVGVSLKF